MPIPSPALDQQGGTLDVGLLYRRIALLESYAQDPNNVALYGGSIGGVSLPALAGYAPPLSSSWPSDSFNGVDVYKAGFVQRPTVFFDPSAVNSRNLGTYKHPYTTVAQLQARVTGSMAGQTLGFKRGSTLRSSTGLALTAYGSSGGPFYITPYGDALAMPIISGGTVRTGWTPYRVDSRIWQSAATFASDVDVFEVISGVYNRLWAVSSIANLQAYIAAPVAGTIGAFTRISNSIFIYLQDASNANGGQIETADATNALRLNYSDVSGTGNIIVCGIAPRMSRDSALSIGAANSSGTNAPSGIQVVGCQTSQAGAQYGTNLGADGIIIYGISDTVRATGCYVAGNYSYDNLNNAIEVGAFDSGTIEKNLGYACGGNSVAELWAVTSSNVIRLNRGYGNPLIRASTRTSSGSNLYHDSGVWIAGYNALAGVTVDATKNVGNKIYGNHIQDHWVWGVDLSGDQNTEVFCNTFATKSANSGAGLRLAGAAASTGRSIYNNLHFRNAGEAFATFVRRYTTGVDLNTPWPATMNYNWYVNKSTPGSSGGGFNDNGSFSFDIASWRTLTGLEANSQASMTLTITDGWTWGPLLNGDGTAWLAANTDYSLGTSDFKLAGTSIASTAMVVDVDGRAVLTPTTPNIGAYQG